MTSTRHPPPVQIFQDLNSTPSSLTPIEKPRPQLQPSAMPLQPLRNPPSHPDIILTAPSMTHQPMSPLKSTHLSPLKQNFSHLNYIPIPPPNGANMYTDSPVKRAQMQNMQTMQNMQNLRQYRPPPAAIAQQPLFTTFNSNFETFEQENYPSSAVFHDSFVDFPESSYVRKHQPLKRSYSDATRIHDRPFQKPRLDDEILTELPAPEDMPAIEDDGNKPSYSYAQMIGMAILRNQNRRLTLAQIYEWISSTFAFYREDSKQGWHNSIRHNLSLNKAFKKQERPKGDAGKGSYWVIEPGMEMTFVRDRNRKGNSLSHMTIHSNVMRPEPPSMPHQLSEMVAPNPFIIQSNVPDRPQTAPALPELSSDATLPASDPALNEEETAEPEAINNSLAQTHSSPPDAINSSPPVAAVVHRRTGSSPTVRPRQASSIQRHKRNATTMDDSGYFSSIESSVLRPNRSGVILTSELDVEPPRKKARGRAEEEIARIRSSSHDVTPSHCRFNASTIHEGQSSSPLRPSPVARLNPVTPSVIFKKPLRPPPSISPNTQLHLHRKAMLEFTNSPIKSFGMWHESLDLGSPFKWASLPSHTAYDEFEIFSDSAVGQTPATTTVGSSPLRGSTKRPPFGRASTTANVLSEVFGSAQRRNTKTPSKMTFLKPTSRSIPTGSPLKGAVSNVALFDEQEDLFDFGSFDNENSDTEEGVDILKGFQKIGGSASQPTVTNNEFIRRPSLGSRSFTSRF